MKNLWVIVFALVVCIAVCLTIYFYFNSTATNNNNMIVGNDRDAHGCIGSAGYTWCEAKQKCIRTWEETCE